MKTYLPISSVVLLKDAEKRLMIVGLMQVEAETEKTWDYSGVFYPEGMYNSGSVHLFNDDQIEMIFFAGFQDAEGINFMNALNNHNNDTDE
ncbi:MAG: DUF4176 domain-containing protein [Defluviitaleaceae bacterium]|nr:DUF4176 domain-containing protein [Defluviitaleaceae bacterium]